MCVGGLSVFINNSFILILAGPLPTLDGITDVAGKRNVSLQGSPLPPINHDDVRHFKRSFNAAGPVSGFLDGTRFF